MYIVDCNTCGLSNGLLQPLGAPVCKKLIDSIQRRERQTVGAALQQSSVRPAGGGIYGEIYMDRSMYAGLPCRARSCAFRSRNSAKLTRSICVLQQSYCSAEKTSALSSTGSYRTIDRICLRHAGLADSGARCYDNVLQM